jgi:hypothetical protein
MRQHKVDGEKGSSLLLTTTKSLYNLRLKLKRNFVCTYLSWSMMGQWDH